MKYDGVSFMGGSSNLVSCLFLFLKTTLTEVQSIYSNVHIVNVSSLIHFDT